MFLMIENRTNSVPSFEMLRMLGASGSRGDESKIGQFGSGVPNSLALFARHGILNGVKVCLSEDVYTFNLKAHAVKDGNYRNVVLEEICIKKQNGGTCNLNISTEFGGIDWTDLTMGVREFVSNAYDGNHDSFGSYDGVRIEIVEDNQARKKTGTVRVFIPLTPAIQEYYDNLSKYFLMASPYYDSSIRVIFHNSYIHH